MNRKAALALVLLASLGACKRGDDAAEAVATDVPTDVAVNATAAVVENEYGTPVKDRVATIGLLNKRNNLTQDMVIKSGEAKRFGNVVVKVATCERSLPWESPPEVGAFVQVFVEERERADQPLVWRKVFSGWLFKNSPSLNVVEHPVYDVWVKDCAMKFPGEEDAPAPAASASSAAKPAGSASPAALPSAKPSPKPSPKPSAAASPSIGL
ncbi:DUF2155 domain-containing protein [Novosphingobium sp.]|uniref:DUF2155 domain-containing protein n=1 Tax=Novosphingobium sp. TaxID=1874826 RepID=UPI00286B5704|nr:DUF2155 domain-containing protein [Novosphingobium sp.]